MPEYDIHSNSRPFTEVSENPVIIDEFSVEHLIDHMLIINEEGHKRSIFHQGKEIGQEFIAGTAALLTGAFTLSKLAIFRGRDFMTPDLTGAQILVMDAHNDHHRKVDGVELFGRGVAALSSELTAVQSEAIAKINSVSTESLDNDVKDLPGILAHTH